MTERANEQMQKHFPSHDTELLWYRNLNDGYSTIPRTLPIAMQAIDSLSKGNPGGHTLFCLWARAPDHPFLVIESPTIFAAEAGFTGERASDTWRRRMRRLKDLGFIRSKKGVSGDFHYVLLLNPNIALYRLLQDGKLQEHLVDRFEYRVDEIGAQRDIQEFKEMTESHGEENEQASEKSKKKTGRSTKASARSRKKGQEDDEHTA